VIAPFDYIFNIDNLIYKGKLYFDMNYIFIIISGFTLVFSVFLILATLGSGLQQQVFSETKSLLPIGTSVSTYRTEVTAVTIGDNIYVIGGIDNLGKALDTVEVYNTKNDSWKKVSSLPQPLHHSAASSFNDKIYVIGGSSSPNDNWDPTNKLFIYDPIMDKWVEDKPMPTARGAMTANFVNGILYVIGGYGSNQIVDVNEAYDPLSNEWISKKPIPTPRHHAASAVVDNQLFIIGGIRIGFYPIVNTDITERYDPKEDKWVTLEPMPSKRSGISAASINNTTIYVFGGGDLMRAYDNNEKYTIQSNKWEPQEPLPISPYVLAAVSINEKVYIIGGIPSTGLTVTSLNEIFNIKENIIY
jgi:N-acetylneuraminic acid mutarotase